MLVETYKGYTVVLSTIPTGGGEFVPAFWITLDNGTSQPLARTTIEGSDPVYHTVVNHVGVFTVEDEAHQVAREIAHEWVDGAVAANYSIRGISNITGGDYVSFELLVENKWREVQVSGSTLAVLDRGSDTDRFDVVRQHLEKIILAGASKALSTPDAASVQINGSI